MTSDRGESTVLRRFLKSQRHHLLAAYKQPDDWAQLLYFIVLKTDNVAKRNEFYTFIDLCEKDAANVGGDISIDFAFLPSEALPLLAQYEPIYPLA